MSKKPERRFRRNAHKTGRSAPTVAAEPTREIQVTVHAIAAGGDGVARAEGLVVFLPRTAPGDEGMAEVVVRKSFARGEMRVLDRPSPERVEPPCVHYVRDRCGGCQLQHLNYPAQLEAKRVIVQDALTRIAGQPVHAPAVAASPELWRYRTKLTLALRRSVARPPDATGLAAAAIGWTAGLHPYDDPVGVFALEDCPITDVRVLEAWAAILAAGPLLPHAEALRGAVRLTSAGPSLVVEGGRRWVAAPEFIEAVPELAELWWAPEGARPRLLHRRAESPAADATAPSDMSHAGEGPGASFTQVNAAVAEQLRAAVETRVLAHAPARVVDGYAGTGEYARRLASAGVDVTAIERDEAAVAWLSPRLPAGSRAVAASVEDALAGALPADVVILNPPRGGVDARVTALLAAERTRLRAIVYVSCDPATLARDTARLPGWRIASVETFDMFPQTAHVETVCELVPEER